MGVGGGGEKAHSPMGWGCFTKYADQGSPFDKQFASDEEEEETTVNGVRRA